MSIPFEIGVNAPAVLLNLGDDINGTYSVCSWLASMQICSDISHSINTIFNTLPDIPFRTWRISVRRPFFSKNSVPYNFP
jgi:hypothetical protein